MNRLERVEKWDKSNPSTLKGFPSGIPWDDERTFEKVKKGHLDK
jgi:hypothetical protein